MSNYVTRLAFVLFLTVAACASAESSVDPLQAGFVEPPPSAWPRTWWHWTKGAITKTGITKDLEWMKRSGMAGFQLADVNFGGGQSIEPTVDFGSTEWLEALQHAASEADRLGLEMAVFSSPGWSMTGGPWVKPEQAMKKLVWSETRVAGPSKDPIQLATPPDKEGPFLDFAAGRSPSVFYRDAKVLAFRTPEAELRGHLIPVVAQSSEGEINGDLLYDGKLAGSVELAAAKDAGETWIEYQFDAPVTVRAITIAGRQGIPCGRITASDDGMDYRTVVSLPGSQLYRQARVRTFAIPATTARFYRLELTGAPLRPAETMSETAPEPAESYSLVEWRLEGGARIHRWEEKAGFGHLFEYETVSSPAVTSAATLPSGQVLDLTDQLDAAGRLHWEAPSGEWTVLRFGYSLTGARNRPATPAGHGYEVDKLSRKHTRAYFDAYSGMLSRATGELYGKSLRYWIVDSWEAGTQNWTDRMIAEFAERRGYDPTPYLPALAGRVVGDAQTSDRFLWDFRRTLADMFADNHYGELHERLADSGLGLYAEAAGVSLEIPEDTLLNKSKVDIPMGEFWFRDLHPRLMYLQDVRGAASAAHVYGKPLVAAEAFTGGGYESPFSLKKVGDYWLAQGLNRLVYHTSAHQPTDELPGNTMVGTHLHRHITWAEHVSALNTYFARICFLLQQGKPIVDVAYLLEEGAPSTPPIWADGDRHELPEGYKHDYINADVLLNRLEVDRLGRLVLPDGMAYQLLVLPESRRMRPELLAKLLDLVQSGATILGPRPRHSPSLMGQPESDSRVTELAEEIWGDLNGATRTVRTVGKGMVVWGRTVTGTLNRMELVEDLTWSGPLDTQIAWTHRRTGEADTYYLSNLTSQPASIQARFRVNNGGAELWRPDTGKVSACPVKSVAQLSEVNIQLAGNETLFVVFRDSAQEQPTAGVSRSKIVLAELTEPWSVTFPKELGAPSRIQLEMLKPLSEHENSGVKYFSGTATYAVNIEAEEAWLTPGRQLELDLGDVRDLSEVTLNGAALGLRWKPPYTYDVTDRLQAGTNRLEVKVINQWTNRIVGDLAKPEEEAVLPAVRSATRFRSPELKKSGLLGPVTILAVE